MYFHCASSAIVKPTLHGHLNHTKAQPDRFIQLFERV